MTTTAARYIRRDPADIAPWAETCGQIRCLIEAKDEAAAEVHHVQIYDARLHYHARTDEFYYVIDGQGTMVLDDDEIELHRGVVVYVPRGVKHKARGDLTVLTICIPPAFPAVCWTTSTSWSELFCRDPRGSALQGDGVAGHSQGDSVVNVG